MKTDDYKLHKLIQSNRGFQLKLLQVYETILFITPGLLSINCTLTIRQLTQLKIYIIQLLRFPR